MLAYEQPWSMTTFLQLLAKLQADKKQINEVHILFVPEHFGTFMQIDTMNPRFNAIYTKLHFTSFLEPLELREQQNYSFVFHLYCYCFSRSFAR